MPEGDGGWQSKASVLVLVLLGIVALPRAKFTKSKSMMGRTRIFWGGAASVTLPISLTLHVSALSFFIFRSLLACFFRELGPRLLFRCTRFDCQTQMYPFSVSFWLYFYYFIFRVGFFDLCEHSSNQATTTWYRKLFRTRFVYGGLHL